HRSGDSSGLPGWRVKRDALSVTKDTRVNIEVVVDHAVDGEAALGSVVAGAAVKTHGALHTGHRRSDAVCEDAGDAVLDEFRHRPAGVGDDWGAAQHRLDDREAEWLGERDGMHETACRAQDLGPLLATDGSEVSNTVAVDVRLDLLGEVPLVLHRAAEYERPFGAAGDLDRLCGARVGVDPAEAYER